MVGPLGSIVVRRTAVIGVRRDKAALSSGCKAHPAIRSSRKQSATQGRSLSTPAPVRALRPRTPDPAWSWPVGMWKRGHGRTSEAPPDERGGYRYVRPTATASHLDSTRFNWSATLSPLGPTTPGPGDAGRSAGGSDQGLAGGTIHFWVYLHMVFFGKADLGHSFLSLRRWYRDG
jgi:hypothetical protein